MKVTCGKCGAILHKKTYEYAETIGTISAGICRSCAEREVEATGGQRWQTRKS